jgi:hypothetical protein
MNHQPERWNRLAATLRRAGAGAAPDTELPPPGFATRVLALAREEAARYRRSALFPWRRRALAAAACCVAGYAMIALAVTDPEPQFLPLPALDLPVPSP